MNLRIAHLGEILYHVTNQKIHTYQVMRVVVGKARVVYEVEDIDVPYPSIKILTILLDEEGDIGLFFDRKEAIRKLKESKKEENEML